MNALTLKNKLLIGVPMVTAALCGVSTAFAASEPALPGLVITPEMLQPVVDGPTSNIAVVLPIGISLFGILIGVGLVPKLIKKFSGGF